MKLEEQWRQIVGFERYEVSNFGNVRTFLKIGGRGAIGLVPRVVKQTEKRRYRRISISDGVRKWPKSVHRLVLETFIGPCPEGMEGCHGDGVRNNNALTNLRWDTHESNMLDKVSHGTISAGETNGRSVLSELQVRAVREVAGWKYGMLSELAREFGVSPTTILKVKNNKSWSHI